MVLSLIDVHAPSAAARADNFYHGPDYDPAKHGSLTKVRFKRGNLGVQQAW